MDLPKPRLGMNMSEAFLKYSDDESSKDTEIINVKKHSFYQREKDLTPPGFSSDSPKDSKRKWSLLSPLH